MFNTILGQRASGNVDYIVSKMAIDSKRKSEVLLIQIQFCKIGRFHRFWNFFCSRATVVRQAFLSQSKNHYSLLCLRLSPFHIRIAKWFQQAKWIFICSFSNFIPLARTKWKLIVQKLIKNFQGRNGFRQPNHIGVGLYSLSLSIFCSFNHHFKTAKIRKSHCELFSPLSWFCAMCTLEKPLACYDFDLFKWIRGLQIGNEASLKKIIIKLLSTTWVPDTFIHK